MLKCLLIVRSQMKKCWLSSRQLLLNQLARVLTKKKLAKLRAKIKHNSNSKKNCQLRKMKMRLHLISLKKLFTILLILTKKSTQASSHQTFTSNSWKQHASSTLDTHNTALWSSRNTSWLARSSGIPKSCSREHFMHQVNPNSIANYCSVLQTCASSTKKWFHSRATILIKELESPSNMTTRLIYSLKNTRKALPSTFLMVWLLWGISC